MAALSSRQFYGRRDTDRCTMQIDLTPEQSEFIRHAIDAGRVQCPEDAIQEERDGAYMDYV